MKDMLKFTFHHLKENKLKFSDENYYIAYFHVNSYCIDGK
jgi:hypothetical protein